MNYFDLWIWEDTELDIFRKICLEFQAGKAQDCVEKNENYKAFLC